MEPAPKPQTRLSIPAWIFDNKGKYFLLIFKKDGTIEVDGGHSSRKGCDEAKHLITRLGLEGGVMYRVIKIEEVREFKGKVNEDAINTLRPAIARYGRKEHK